MTPGDSGEPSRATRDYAAHYAQRDLATALALYEELAAEHPGAP